MTLVGILFGIGFIAVGTLIAVFRNSLLAFFLPILQRGLGRGSAARAKSSYYLYPAIGAMIVGVFLIVVSVARGH